MNHAKAVMKSPAFRNKSTDGRHFYIHLSLGVWPFLRVHTVRGHTWNEAFRRAAIVLVTNRLSH